MESLKSYVNEALTKSNILAHTHKGLQPSDIRNFLKIAEDEGFNVGSENEDEYTIVFNNDGVIVARIDTDELEVVTNMSKQDFFDVALRKKKGILTKLYK